MSLLVSGIQSLRAALPGNGPALPGLLRSGFGDGMRAMTMQTASQLFPNVNFAPPGAAGRGSGPQATGTGMSQGMGLQMPLPGGQTLTLPTPPGFAGAATPGAGSDVAGRGPLQMPGGLTLPAPLAPGGPGNATGFSSRPAAPGFAGTSMSAGTPPAPASGGLIGSTLGLVRALLAPATAPPPPAAAGNGQLATGAGMTAIPAAIATAVAVPGRVLGNALPHASATTVAGQAVTPPLVAASSAAPPAAAMAQPGVGMQQAPPASPAGQPVPTAAAPGSNPLSMPAPGATQATLTTPQAVPQTSANTAPATRADAVPPSGPLMSDRPAAMPLSQAPMPPGAPSAPPGVSLLAAVPLAAAIQAPAGQQVAGNTQLAGNPQATAPVAGNIGGPSRAELTPTGVYTAEGPGLRRRERMRVGPREIGGWMLALREGRLHLVRPHDDDTPREVARAFQWLFWVLALVAYGCLALVLGSFLLSFGELPSAPTMHRWTGEFALAGLVAAGGAWWLARRLAPPDRGGQGTPPQP